MLNSVVQDSKTATVIARWLAERNELLVLYCRLTGKRKDQVLPDKSQINQFCDILIDYVSAGHFEVYEQLVSYCDQKGPQSLQLLEDVFPQISETTDIVVDFNDKYSDDQAHEELMSQLDHDLSKLGEAIAFRVELEDKLIDTLAEHH
ncbi:MAG: sigma D regulator [Gammaproteobacteria bacterium]|nr:sigma D regulator [Gammaproteobacteria bacterium]NVK86621.1 sigma D regulator [Gammaproteobacteria bacterium]